MSARLVCACELAPVLQRDLRAERAENINMHFPVSVYNSPGCLFPGQDNVQYVYSQVEHTQAVCMMTA